MSAKMDREAGMSGLHGYSYTYTVSFLLEYNLKCYPHQ